jgi:RNA polymerase sigma-70 factor (subfamily 1)
MVRVTLDRMAAGGIYDHLGGGFARYSVDARWLVPHFEKMLYDNALLAGVYLDAFLAMRVEGYARVVRETGRIDASDIVQLTYVTALQSFSQFTGSRQGEFCAWLYTVHDRVVQRVARDHVRTQKRSVQREERKTDSHLGQLGVIVDSTASQKVVHQESLVKLTLSMDALPEDQREAVRLRYCEGWPLERIAREMNRTMPSVAGLLKRGLKTLRARLANDI